MVDVNHIATLYSDNSSNNLKEFKMNSTTIHPISASFSPSALLVPLALAAIAVLAMSFSSTSSNTAPQVSSVQPQQWLVATPAFAQQAESLEVDTESPLSCCDQSR
jgi:predicted NAD/FAD-dependent oxidoreductase